MKILNKDAAGHDFRISATGLPGIEIDYGGPVVRVGPGAVHSVPVRIRIPEDTLEGGADILVTIEATDQPSLTATGKARFIAPSD